MAKKEPVQLYTDTKWHEKIMLPIYRKNHFYPNCKQFSWLKIIASKSPSQTSFNITVHMVQWHFFPKLPITVTGSYRTCTGFSINPCGTYSDWFKTNKCYLIFAISVYADFLLFVQYFLLLKNIVSKNIQYSRFISLICFFMLL